MTDLVGELRAKIDSVVRSVLARKSVKRVVLLDVPDYPNVGDSAIFLGELAFFRRAYSKIRIDCISSRTYSSELNNVIEMSDVLFLQGGGNFGDIWPRHQDFRNHIFNRFAHKTIIHFPQSFHFEHDKNIEEARRFIAKAKSLTILARDHKGFAFANSKFDCRMELCPDMAFAIGTVSPPVPKVDYACLLRTDKEVLQPKIGEIEAMLKASGSSFAIGDWTENRFGIEKLHGLLRIMRHGGLPSAFLAKHGLPAYDLYARSRLRYGITILGHGRTVITDRLHGHILSTLMARPQFIFDSLDGKVRAFHDTWLSHQKGVHFLDNVEDLRSYLAARAAQPA